MPTYRAAAYSSDTFGRAHGEVRANRFLIDDPQGDPYNGPGEAPGSGEFFLTGVVGCAVLMIGRIAQAEGLPLERVRAEMEASREPDTSRDGFAVFERARLKLELTGLTDEQAGQLVETFKRR